MAEILSTITSETGSLTADVLLWNGEHATLNSPAMPEDVQEWVDDIEATLKGTVNTDG